MTLQLLLIALVVSLEPLPLTGFILTLSTDRGAKNGLGFLAGWIASLVGVIVLTLALTGGKPPAPSTAPSTGVLAAKIAVGVGLVIFAWHYHRRPVKEQAQPGWMKNLDKMSVWTAALLAFLLQPWGIVAGAALTISEANTSHGSDVAALIAFCFFATISLLVMEGYVLFSPVAARDRLDGLRQWMDTHKHAMIVYLSLVVGFVLIGRSAYALAG